MGKATAVRGYRVSIFRRWLLESPVWSPLVQMLLLSFLSQHDSTLRTQLHCVHDLCRTELPNSLLRFTSKSMDLRDGKVDLDGCTAMDV